mmetsp:Transcript_20937/g.62456  ORF Transcript_20937/g.62456 Transcript_20937/m.62456 type:complete len:506 (-) Transcript_20937:23-1540(-)
MAEGEAPGYFFRERRPKVRDEAEDEENEDDDSDGGFDRAMAQEPKKRKTGLELPAGPERPALARLKRTKVRRDVDSVDVERSRRPDSRRSWRCGRRASAGPSRAPAIRARSPSASSTAGRGRSSPEARTRRTTSRAPSSRSSRRAAPSARRRRGGCARSSRGASAETTFCRTSPRNRRSWRSWPRRASRTFGRPRPSGPSPSPRRRSSCSPRPRASTSWPSSRPPPFGARYVRAPSSRRPTPTAPRSRPCSTQPGRTRASRGAPTPYGPTRRGRARETKWCRCAGKRASRRRAPINSCVAWTRFVATEVITSVAVPVASTSRWPAAVVGAAGAWYCPVAIAWRRRASGRRSMRPVAYADSARTSGVRCADCAASAKSLRRSSTPRMPQKSANSLVGVLRAVEHDTSCTPRRSRPASAPPGWYATLMSASPAAVPARAARANSSKRGVGTLAGCSGPSSSALKQKACRRARCSSSVSTSSTTRRGGSSASMNGRRSYRAALESAAS